MNAFTKGRYIEVPSYFAKLVWVARESEAKKSTNRKRRLIVVMDTRTSVPPKPRLPADFLQDINGRNSSCVT